MARIARLSGVRGSLIAFGVFVVTVVAVVVGALFAFLPLSPVSAGGGGDGTKVAETTFTVNVEPIKVEFAVTSGSPYYMHPGDTATIEVNMTNLSLTDWEVEVAVIPSIKNSPFGGDKFARMEAYWEGSLYRPGELVVVGAGSILTLNIKIYALDGAGTAEIYVSVHRVKPFTPTESG